MSSLLPLSSDTIYSQNSGLVESSFEIRNGMSENQTVEMKCQAQFRILLADSLRSLKSCLAFGRGRWRLS
jgi:hypothetical protein